jgi:hypothetical protein
MAELVGLYPGAADTIRHLRGRGLRTAIVSTKFRYRIEDILNRAESSGLVDVIVGGEDVASTSRTRRASCEHFGSWTCTHRARCTSATIRLTLRRLPALRSPSSGY